MTIECRNAEGRFDKPILSVFANILYLFFPLTFFYNLAKRLAPLFLIHSQIRAHKTSVTAAKRAVYPVKPSFHPSKAINPTQSSMVYPKPPNIAIITPKLCLIGVISLVQLRFGILSPKNSPNNAENRTKDSKSRAVKTSSTAV